MNDPCHDYLVDLTNNPSKDGALTFFSREQDFQSPPPVKFIFFYNIFLLFWCILTDASKCMHSCEFHFHGGVLTMDDGASSPFTWFHASCVVSSFLRVTWFHASLSASSCCWYICRSSCCICCQCPRIGLRHSWTGENLRGREHFIAIIHWLVFRFEWQDITGLKNGMMC